jgi:glycosyltransferase involved in cell wall biosynthesis
MYGCYRHSRLYSLPVAITEYLHQLKKTWQRAVDGYIALTEFGRQKFIQCGLPRERIFVKPNSLDAPPLPKYAKGDYAIYLGRLSQEKGLDVLLDAAECDHRTSPSPLKIKIVGDGPLTAEVKKKIEEGKLGKVELVGRQSHDECMALLSDAGFMIMPSLCYENFPMAIREAFACGKPVITSRLGAMAEIVVDKRTGLLFNPGDGADLAEKMRWMTENEDACIRMGRNARAEFENKFTAERNFDSLMDIYRKTISAKRT